MGERGGVGSTTSDGPGKSSEFNQKCAASTLAYGPDVEGLALDSLREAVAARIEAALARYRRPGSAGATMNRPPEELT